MDTDFVSQLLFPAPSASYTADSFPGELIWIPKSLGALNAGADECIPSVLLGCQKARYIILYLHGNGEDLGRSYPFLQEMRDRFLSHVLAVEYPGYGICPGAQCDEKGAIANSLTAFHFCLEVLRWPVDRILIMGRSIGTGPAMSLASKHAVKGLCLISPFLSVRELFQDHLGPLSYLIEERFPNKELIPTLHCSCLVVHGEKDIIIPPRHGVELFEACSSNKRLVLLPEMDHNANLFENYFDFAVPVLQFFSTQACGVEEIQVPKWAFDRKLSPFKPAGQEPGLSAAASAACVQPMAQGKWYLAAALGEFMGQHGLFSCSCSCDQKKLNEDMQNDLDLPRPVLADSYMDEELDAVPDDGCSGIPGHLPLPNPTPVKYASLGSRKV